MLKSVAPGQPSCVRLDEKRNSLCAIWPHAHGVKVALDDQLTTAEVVGLQTTDKGDRLPLRALGVATTQARSTTSTH